MTTRMAYVSCFIFLVIINAITASSSAGPISTQYRNVESEMISKAPPTDIVEEDLRQVSSDFVGILSTHFATIDARFAAQNKHLVQLAVEYKAELNREQESIEDILQQMTDQRQRLEVQLVDFQKQITNQAEQLEILKKKVRKLQKNSDFDDIDSDLESPYSNTTHGHCVCNVRCPRCPRCASCPSCPSCPDVQIADPNNVPFDCSEVLEANPQAPSGIYAIRIPHIDSDETPSQMAIVRVYCDMESDGGGWTVIQRRQDGSQDFVNRNEHYYLNGFGSLSGEHWLGLSKINALTSVKEFNLRIDTIDSNGSFAVVVVNDILVCGRSRSQRERVYTYDVNSYFYVRKLSPGRQHTFSLTDCLLQFSSLDTNLTAVNSTAEVLIKGTRFRVDTGNGGWWFPETTTGYYKDQSNAEHLNGNYPIKWSTYYDDGQYGRYGKGRIKIAVTDKTLVFTEMKVRPVHFKYHP